MRESTQVALVVGIIVVLGVLLVGGLILYLYPLNVNVDYDEDNKGMYIAKGEECERVKFACVIGYEYFIDSVGCGCRPSDENEEIELTECKPSQRDADFCTAIYNPVCGWNDPAKIQCIRYPCAQTYGNSCEACKNENVIAWSQGECPA